jgi:hypothetical protein
MDNIKYGKNMGDNRRAIPLLLQPFVYTSHDHFEKQKMTLVTEDIIVEK